MKKSMREGAKAMFASFFFLIVMVWSLKECLIMIFLRLTYVFLRFNGLVADRMQKEHTTVHVRACGCSRFYRLVRRSTHHTIHTLLAYTPQLADITRSW